MNNKNYPNLKPWKRGQSGNPAGRKPGSKNVSTIVRKLLEQKAVDEMLSSNKLNDLANGQPTSYAQAMVLVMIKKALEERLEELRSSIRIMVDKIKLVSSATAISYMEQDVQKAEEEILLVEERKSKLRLDREKVDIKKVMGYVKYYMEHLEELLVDLSDPVLKAKYFSVLFNKPPTYQEIKDGTLKKLFQQM